MNSKLTVNAEKNGTAIAIPDRARRLSRSVGELVFCGVGPTEGSLSFIDSATGAVVVLFVARLQSVAAAFAFFEPDNLSLRSAGRCTSIAVRPQDINGVISIGTPAVVGPLSVDSAGYLEGAGAWSL